MQYILEMGQFNSSCIPCLVIADFSFQWIASNQHCWKYLVTRLRGNNIPLQYSSPCLLLLIARSNFIVCAYNVSVCNLADCYSYLFIDSIYSYHSNDFEIALKFACQTRKLGWFEEHDLLASSLPRSSGYLFAYILYSQRIYMQTRRKYIQRWKFAKQEIWIHVYLFTCHIWKIKVHRDW